MSFQISPELDAKKVFLVRSSELEGRLDPNFIFLSKILADKFANTAFKLVKFGTCIKYIQYGISSLANKEGKGTPIIRMNNLKGDGWNFSDVKHIELSHDELEKHRLFHGDILFNRTNSKELVGKCGVFRESEDYVFASYLIRVRLDESLLLPDFASFFLGSTLGRLQIDCISRQIIGMTNINAEEIKLIKIPVPPLEIQYAIVAKMDAAYASKREKEAEAQRLLDSIDAYLLGELGIELPEPEENTVQSRIFIRRFSEISGGRFDPFSHQLIKNEKIGIYGFSKLKYIANIRKGDSITSDKISEGNIPVIAGGKTSPYSHNIANTEGDVITISASGAYSGYVWYHEIPIFASDCTIIFSKDKSILNNIFLFEYLKAEQQNIYNLQQGSGQPHVYPSDLAKIKIPLPPRSVQNEIADHITLIRSRAKQLQQEAKEGLEQAKRAVEAMILGDA